MTMTIFSNLSEHYAHSTYTDNVLTELIGVLPQEDDTLVIDPLVPNNWTYFAVEDILYHGHNVTIIWDKTGQKYKKGAGFSVFVDGKLKKNQKDLGKMEVGGLPFIEAVRSAQRIGNYAAKPELSVKYPIAYASYQDNSPGVAHQAINGRIIYDQLPSDRWTNLNSKRDTDWLAIDFGRNKTFSSITLFIYSDAATGEGRIDCPTKMIVQFYDGTDWKDAANQVSTPVGCVANEANQISFKAVRTSQLRVVFTRNKDKDYYVGVTELQVWAPFPAGLYHQHSGHQGGGV